MKLFQSLTAAGVLVMAAAAPAAALDLTGAGSTFVYPVLASWADAYKKATGVGLNYQSIGSGGGIKQIQAKTVTFGATDMPLSSADVAKDGFVQFPVINGAVVPAVTLPGIKPGDLTLDGADARQYLPGQDHQVERPGDREAQSERQAAGHGNRRRPPLGWFRHDVHLDRLPVQDQPGVEG